MSDPFHLRDDDCWECIAEELDKAANKSIGKELRSLVKDPLGKVPRSQLDTFTFMHRFEIDQAAKLCRISRRYRY